MLMELDTEPAAIGSQTHQEREEPAGLARGAIAQRQEQATRVLPQPPHIDDRLQRRPRGRNKAQLLPSLEAATRFSFPTC
jgi:hypothetical protein